MTHITFEYKTLEPFSLTHDQLLRFEYVGCFCSLGTYWFSESPLLSSGLSFRVVSFIDTSLTSPAHAAAIERPTPTQYSPNCSSGISLQALQDPGGLRTSWAVTRYLWVRATHHIGAIEGLTLRGTQNFAHTPPRRINTSKWKCITDSCGWWIHGQT